LGSLMN
jgi:hypothetical protein